MVRQCTANRRPESPVRKVVARNSVGAGDALLAGVIASAESGKDPEEWLADGVATGTSATQVLPGEPSRRAWQQIHGKRPLA